jgi:hypothetical protein
VSAVSAAAAGRRAVSFAEDGSALVWNLRKPATRPLQMPGAETVSACAVEARGRFAIAGTRSGALVHIDLRGGLAREILRLGEDAATAIAMSESGHLAAVGDRRGRIRLVDLQRRVELRVIEAHADRVTGLAFTDGSTIISASMTSRCVRGIRPTADAFGAAVTKRASPRSRPRRTGDSESPAPRSAGCTCGISAGCGAWLRFRTRPSGKTRRSWRSRSRRMARTPSPEVTITSFAPGISPADARSRPSSPKTSRPAPRPPRATCSSPAPGTGRSTCWRCRQRHVEDMAEAATSVLSLNSC